MKPEILFFVGIGLIFLGTFLVMISSILMVKNQNVKTEVAIGGFIGPIPFGFATSKNAYYALIALLILFLLIWLVLTKL